MLLRWFLNSDPIALCNVLMKVVRKVIVNRLKHFMTKLIGDTQSSFIPRRQLADNIVLAQEMVHSMKRRKGKQGVMVMKIDLKKAYDQIEWDFLETILHNVGFENHLRD